ncbi:MAG: glycosyltransferase family 2 protein [Bdellovibrionales bacterium]|nr:glycosyltransferase family 2 protein [Oligoflexia bacterium]
MRPITAMLIVRNEESFIERALASVLWCDEIIVVDAFSHDCTPILCRDPQKPWAQKIKFFQQEWLGFSSQRNFAISKATHPWIFFLDADEACSPELATKIQALLSSHDLAPAQYKVRRQEFFLKKPIHHGIWNPSFHIRFFFKEGFQFTGAVHEGVKSDYQTLIIDEPIIHVEDLRIERFLSKLNHYTSIQAKEDFERGVRTNLFRILMSFPAMFYKNYIYYGAYKDGHEGVIISVLEGISRTVRHLKIWQMSQVNSPSSSL